MLHWIPWRISMLYVIRNNDTNQYVAVIPPNATIGQTYTFLIEQARTFVSREAAELYGTCGNESIVRLSDLLQSTRN